MRFARRALRGTMLSLCAIVSVAAPAVAGFGSTETYLPAVGRVPGKNGAQFYTTVWATNLTTAPQTMTFQFLKSGQANPSPASFHDTLQPGETKVYENVVESKLGLSDALGAARITSTGEIFVSERIYNQSPGDDLGNTEGLFFAGVPKTFSISAGQSASIQGIDQGGSENFRYNFALIETGGGSPTVNVQIFDGNGTLLGQKAFILQPYEQIQPGVGDVVSGIKTTNARITATVTGGSGSVLLAGAQVANESQDSSGFEMTFRDSLLGGGGGGTVGVTSLNALTGALTLKPGNGISITPSGSQISIAYTGGGGSGLTAVAHDASLAGDGTGGSPLGIANGQVVRSVNGLHDNLTLAAGSNVTITPNGSTLTIASSGGGGAGFSLPFAGTATASQTAFAIGNTGSGRAIEGDVSNSSAAVAGVSHGSGPGIYGENQSGGDAGHFVGKVTVAGDLSANSVATTGIIQGAYIAGNAQGVYGAGGSNDGVYGTSTSSNGIEGNVSNASAGVAGVNHGSGPGIYGENQSGGPAGDFYGDVIVGGNITYSGSLTHSSDGRFKENVEPIENALDRIVRLRGVTFDWRRANFPERRFRGGRDVGFIAQEVEEVYPELVVTDRDGYKSVDYSALTPILVEAIKTQQKTIDEQQQEIDELIRALKASSILNPDGSINLETAPRRGWDQRESGKRTERKETGQ